uniref:Uncharacterized protein n=1 Tax=Anguilla anguilla TaxID=7936 RepID=A0A0E9W6L5_ANGAN
MYILYTDVSLHIIPSKVPTKTRQTEQMGKKGHHYPAQAVIH